MESVLKVNQLRVEFPKFELEPERSIKGILKKTEQYYIRNFDSSHVIDVHEVKYYIQPDSSMIQR